MNISKSVTSLAAVALIAYALLKFLHVDGQKGNRCKRLSFASFTRQFLRGILPVEWRIRLREILDYQRAVHQIDMGIFG